MNVQHAKLIIRKELRKIVKGIDIKEGVIEQFEIISQDVQNIPEINSLGCSESEKRDLHNHAMDFLRVTTLEKRIYLKGAWDHYDFDEVRPCKNYAEKKASENHTKGLIEWSDAFWYWFYYKMECKEAKKRAQKSSHK